MRKLILGLITALMVVGAAGPALAQGSVGVVDTSTGQWFLRNPSNGQTTSFFFGNPGDLPMVGDWDGDGDETPGLYRQIDGFVYLRNSNSQGVADIRFFFGNPGDIPLAGDFDGDGFDSVAIYRPAAGQIFIINKLGANEGGLGAADYSYFFGNPGDKPFVGDFDGDGDDEVGLHRESTGLVYFRFSTTQGVAEAQFIFGDPGDKMMAADWDVDVDESVGLFRPSNSTMYLRYSNTQGVADQQFTYGMPTGLPVAGEFGVLSGGGTPPTPPPPPPPPPQGIGSGTWRVGVDISPGVYRNAGFSPGCYWERLSGFGGTFAEIITNNFDNVRQIVEIKPTDAGFSTDTDCGVWSNNLAPLKAPTASFSGGTWQVPSEVQPGTWVNTPADTGCYWERRSGFDGTLDDVIANDFVPDASQSVVTVQAGDVGFYADEQCGVWTFVG